MTAGIGQRYRVTQERLGAQPVIVVSSPDRTARVTLAGCGATLLSWQIARSAAPREPLELTDGYRDEAELLAQDGVRNGLLAPFPNRIADGRYRFDGIDYDLLPQPPDHDAQRLIYHGFARTLPFDLIDATTTADAARLTLHTRIRPGQHDGYPFSIDLDVTYRIAAHDLDIEIQATNTGDAPAPYAAGWHPYFRLPGTVDDWTLEIPARTVIRTDRALIPIDGGEAYRSLDECPSMDFRRPRTLAGLIIDACFTDLDFGHARQVETVLRNPGSGDELRVRQSTGSMHVFTADTLARDRRGSIALEPVETVTNAFNRDECASAIRLEPGQCRAFRFGVRYVPVI